MLKWIETTGRSEEDAIAAALFQLGLERDDVSVEVIERAKSGFLGFGGNPAKVRVSYEVPGEEESSAPQGESAPVEPAVSKPAAPAEPKPEAPKPVPSRGAALEPGDEVLIGGDSPAEEEEPHAAPAQSQQAIAPQDDPKVERIHQFLSGLMTHLHVEAVPEVYPMETGYKVVLQGHGLGAIIGRRGETLDAIQQLTNYAVNHGQSKRVRIHLDAEGYRAKREESLQRLALKMAGKVVKYRKNMTLEPMNAYERHVIHSALQDYPNVSTYSTGVEPNRRTVVAYAPDRG